MNTKYGLTSFGLWRISAQIKKIVGDNSSLVSAFPFVLTAPDVYVGWGYRASGRKAKALAIKRNKKNLLLEDGFLSSFRPGRKETRHSFILDFSGMHFHRNAPSDLRDLIERDQFEEKDLERARVCIDKIRKLRLSKYNNRPDLSNMDEHDALDKPYLLMIEQVPGDASMPTNIPLDDLYRQMFAAAAKQYPNVLIAIRAHPANQGVKSLLAAAEKCSVNYIQCPDCNIWDAIEGSIAVLTISSHVGFEALMANKNVLTFGTPFYAGWGLTQDHYETIERQNARSLESVFFASYLKMSKYLDVHTGELCEIETAMAQLATIRDARLNNQNRVHTVGFSLWRRWVLRPFLIGVKGAARHHKSLDVASKFARKDEGVVALWGARSTPPKDVRFMRLEDGFIRSAGLGADLYAPYSICKDDEFLYFDNRGKSKLRAILDSGSFDEFLLQRARLLRKFLIEENITKYNQTQTATNIEPDGVKSGQLKILVAGQVSDDASLEFSNSDVRSNDDLVASTRRRFPDAFIAYKPHPDVAAGLRAGGGQVIGADMVIIDGGIIDWINWADRIETISSLAGFEALLRGRKVGVYGNPFYAGCGLTDDYNAATSNSVLRSLDELVAASLILYPEYIHPQSNLPCSVEELCSYLVNERKSGKTKLFSTFAHRLLSKVTKFTLRK